MSVAESIVQLELFCETREAFIEDLGWVHYVCLPGVGKALIVAMPAADADSAKPAWRRALVSTADGLLLGLIDFNVKSKEKGELLVQLTRGLRSLVQGQNEMVEGTAWSSIDPSFHELCATTRHEEIFGLRLGANFLPIAAQIRRAIQIRILESFALETPDDGRARVPIRVLSMLRHEAGPNTIAHARVEQAAATGLPVTLLVLAASPEGRNILQAIIAGTSLYEAFGKTWPKWILRRWLQHHHRQDALPNWSASDCVAVFEFASATMNASNGPRTADGWVALRRAVLRARELLGTNTPSALTTGSSGGVTFSQRVGLLWALRYHVDRLHHAGLSSRNFEANRSELFKFSMAEIKAAIAVADRVIPSNRDRAHDALGNLDLDLTCLFDRALQIGRRILPTLAFDKWVLGPPSGVDHFFEMASRGRWCVRQPLVALGYIFDAALFVGCTEHSSSDTAALLALTLPAGPGQRYSIRELRAGKNRQVTDDLQRVCEHFVQCIPDNDELDSALSDFDELVVEVRRAQKRCLTSSVVWRSIL